MNRHLGRDVVPGPLPSCQHTQRWTPYNIFGQKFTASRTPSGSISGSSSRSCCLSASKSEHAGPGSVATPSTATPPRHPADVCLQPHNLLPADLSPWSFSLALEELRHLHDIPLVAPRSFLRVESHRQALAAEVAAGPSATWAAAPVGTGSFGFEPPVRSGPRPLADHVSPIHWPTTVPPAAARAAAAAAAQSSRVLAAPTDARAAPTVTVQSGGYLSGYLPTSSALHTTTRPGGGAPQAPCQTQPQQDADSPPPAQPSPPSPRARATSVSSPDQRQHVASIEAQGAAQAQAQPQARAQPGGEADGGDEGGGGVVADGDCTNQGDADGSGSGYCWSGDPWVLRGVPSDSLGGLLLGCASRRVALRLSSLQAYLDELSYRSLELAADDLVSALDGLASYSFRQRLPPAATATAAEAARGRGASWADPILAALIRPQSEAATPSAPSAMSLGTDETRAAVHPFGDATRPPGAGMGAGGGVSDPAAASIQHGGGWRGHAVPRAAFLAPSRAVHLLRLLVRLDVWPPRSWLASFLDCTTHLAARLSGSELVQLMAALAALRAVPGSAWWATVLDTWRASDADGDAAKRPQSAPSSGSWSGIESVCNSGFESGLRLGSIAENVNAIDEAPGPQEVRCAVLYYAARLGAARALGASRLSRWAEEALYDTARALLPSPAVQQVPAAPQSPPPLAVAMALAALPSVFSSAVEWVSDPAGRALGVLTVLVEALEPRLGELPAELLLEVLQGFTGSQLHPGPRFLRQHARALWRRSGRMSSLQLLQAAQHYRTLGMPPTGSLRSAVQRAWEALNTQPQARRWRQQQ